MADEVKNYITPAATGDCRKSSHACGRWSGRRSTTVAWAAGNGDRSENGDYIYGKRKLREIDRRIRYLSKASTAQWWSTTRARRTTRCISAPP